MKPLLLALASCSLAGFASSAPAAENPLLRTGDRIVFLGSTLVERARLYGHLETAMQIAAGPGVDGLVFRNLGWSADSVFADSRSYFGTPEEGRERLARNLAEIEPDVIFLCYGTGEAMSVERGWTNQEGASEKSAAGLEKSLSPRRKAAGQTCGEGGSRRGSPMR